LTFGNEDDSGDLLSKAKLLLPEFEMKPRVHYVGLPKRFIARALYNPERNECIKGVKITIIDNKTGEKRSTLSDDFGAWGEGGAWIYKFRGLAKGLTLFSHQ
jgi:tetrathionate reductase subunit B